MFNKKLNILIIGNNGQLGSYLEKYLRQKSLYKSSKIGLVYGISKKDLDITNPGRVSLFFMNNSYRIKYDIVINCAAFTNTTQAEQAPEESYRVNVLGVKNLATSCAYNKIKLIHISTDYVFSEYSKEQIYTQEFPVNTYGLHKLLGEKEVQLAYNNNNYLIIRTSWLYSNSTNNFVYKFLSNCVKKYKEHLCNTNDCSCTYSVPVVNDCFGKPTSVDFLSRFINKCIEFNISGIIDGQPKGETISRASFAEIILKTLKNQPEVDPIIASASVKQVSSLDIPSIVRHPKLIPTNISLTTTPLHNIQKFSSAMINELYVHDCTATFEYYVADNINYINNYLDNELKKLG